MFFLISRCKTLLIGRSEKKINSYIFIDFVLPILFFFFLWFLFFQSLTIYVDGLVMENVKIQGYLSLSLFSNCIIFSFYIVSDLILRPELFLTLFFKIYYFIVMGLFSFTKFVSQIYRFFPQDKDVIL